MKFIEDKSGSIRDWMRCLRGHEVCEESSWNGGRCDQSWSFFETWFKRIVQRWIRFWVWKWLRTRLSKGRPRTAKPWKFKWEFPRWTLRWYKERLAAPVQSALLKDMSTLNSQRTIRYILFILVDYLNCYVLLFCRRKHNRCLRIFNVWPLTMTFTKISSAIHKT